MYHKYLPLGVLNLPPHISSWSLIFHVSPPVTDNTDNTKKGGGGGSVNQNCIKKIVLFYCNFSQRMCKLLQLFPERSGTPGLLLSMLHCKNRAFMIIWVTVSGHLPLTVGINEASAELLPRGGFLLFFTNMKGGLCVNIPSEQHFLQYSEQHLQPRHIQSKLKWAHFPFLRKSLNFNSLADANVNSLPVTWQKIKTS